MSALSRMLLPLGLMVVPASPQLFTRPSPTDDDTVAHRQGEEVLVGLDDEEKGKEEAYDVWEIFADRGGHNLELRHVARLGGHLEVVKEDWSLGKVGGRRSLVLTGRSLSVSG